MSSGPVILSGARSAEPKDPVRRQPTPTPAVELVDVSFSYGKEPFIEGLSAAFPHGAVTSVVGPNGCGKSTMIKLVDGLLRPQAGEVRIDGVATLSLKAKERARRVAVLAQDTDLIVLDEPTTYLDIRACHETMELVRRLNVEAGKTVVMVIHDLDLALRYSDCLLVMERGRATASGTVGEVLATGAIERAFGVSIRTCATPEGTAYTLFPA